MDALNAALLVNMVGFTVGIALYVLLALMLFRHRDRSSGGVNLLLLLTGSLGLIWNIGELFVFVNKDFGPSGQWPFVSAAAYSALGFLPSVVVHSVRAGGRSLNWITAAAYALSVFASVLHFSAAFSGSPAPSPIAMQTLMFGSLVITAGLLILGARQKLESKTIWASALLIFAVSGFHLSSGSSENSFIVELVAHQSSLPLALAILYQNYRFAFADLFLKRSISLLLISLVAFGLYILVAAPLLRFHETHDRNDVQAISLIITLWIATALIYPSVHRLAVWFVDSVVLKRPDYSKLQASIADSIERCETIDEVLNTVGRRLTEVLTAERYTYREIDVPGPVAAADAVEVTREGVRFTIPTSDLPAFELELTQLGGGRKLLSDEQTMLAAVALVTARRIDAARVMHERCEREFREQEFSKLATEAQLSALRAQINPHFLFNALTTIGYLIQASPDKAFATLLHLTKLLRSVLSNSSEFCTLADEIRLLESYLDIERARFEERLTVEFDVPEELSGLVIPSLILQPLVENAIKHGISENKAGGCVMISAKLRNLDGGSFAELCVADTGASDRDTENGRKGGVGLKNVSERLRSHFGGRAKLSLEKGKDGMTLAKVVFPVSSTKAEFTRFSG
ncbi:MAG: histidine kinase [Chloracidobacterium sp.]|nr:histidine kinase [Chloracidobacterium sp.]